jgi:hypothetical protein
MAALFMTPSTRELGGGKVGGERSVGWGMIREWKQSEGEGGECKMTHSRWQT